jgi:predicted methyltransferase MtxX (methanogen marker protein 4)
MVVEVVDVEVEEVAGEVDPAVVVARFLEVSAALRGSSSGMTTMGHMRKALERLRRIPVGVGVAVAAAEAEAEAVDLEQLDLGNHLSSAQDQFQRQIYWAALAC